MPVGAPNPKRPGVSGSGPNTSAPVGVQAPKPQVAAVPPQAPHPGFVDARPSSPMARAVGAVGGTIAHVGQMLAPSAAPMANVPSVGVSPQTATPAPRQQVGMFEKGGMQTPIYRDELESRPSSSPFGPPAGPHLDVNGMTEQQRTSRQIQNLIRKQSSLYDYNRLSPEDFQSAMVALGGHQGAMDQGSAHVQAAALHAQAQYGADPHRDPAYRQALIAKLGAETAAHQAQSAHYNAQADAEMHPERQLGLLKAINADPELRNFYLAGKGVPMAEIQSLPTAPRPGPNGGPAVNAGNLDQHLAMPQNQGMAALLAQKDMPLVERLRRASQFPGFNDLNSPNRQLFDAHLRQQYTDPKAWARDTYVPPDPDKEWWGVGRLGGLSAALFGSMPWSEGFGTGTGLGWHQNYEDAKAANDLIQKFRISPFG